MGSKYVVYISLFFIIFYILYEYGNEQFINENSLCQELYIKDNNKQIKIINNCFSNFDCKNIIEEGKKYAKKNKWTKKRHSDYPTTDNRITFDWECYENIMKIVEDKVYREIGKLYNIDHRLLGLNEIFIVKYDAKKQKELELHQDGSEFSFILALNQDFEGGGTYFPFLNKHIKLKTGDCLIFSGQNEHQGVTISSGKRYILTGFIHYIEESYCSYNYIDYFSSKIEKMFT